MRIPSKVSAKISYLFDARQKCPVHPRQTIHFCFINIDKDNVYAIILLSSKRANLPYPFKNLMNENVYMYFKRFMCLLNSLIQ